VRVGSSDNTQTPGRAVTKTACPFFSRPKEKAINPWVQRLQTTRPMNSAGKGRGGALAAAAGPQRFAAQKAERAAPARGSGLPSPRRFGFAPRSPARVCPCSLRSVCPALAGAGLPLSRRARFAPLSRPWAALSAALAFALCPARGGRQRPASALSRAAYGGPGLRPARAP
jgi:hypothetical protein